MSHRSFGVVKLPIRCTKVIIVDRVVLSFVAVVPKRLSVVKERVVVSNEYKERKDASSSPIKLDFTYLTEVRHECIGIQAIPGLVDHR